MVSWWLVDESLGYWISISVANKKGQPSKTDSRLPIPLSITFLRTTLFLDKYNVHYYGLPLNDLSTHYSLVRYAHSVRIERINRIFAHIDPNNDTFSVKLMYFNLTIIDVSYEIEWPQANG